MSSVCAEYAHHAPPDAWHTGILLFIETPCMWTKLSTENNRGMNLLLTPLFTEP